MKTIDLIRVSIFTAFIVICSYISFPVFNAVPFSMQIFAVFLIVFCLKPVNSLLSIILYLVMGAGGLPVFAMGNAGIAQFMKPTGGFLLGFVLFPLFQFFPVKNKLIKIFTAFIIFYFSAIIWMSYVLNLSFFNCFYMIWIFIPLDLIKMFFSYMIYIRIKGLKFINN